MDETILLPSPNWFQVSGFAVSSDGWIVYGGPSKSLCVLEPMPPQYNYVIVDKPGFHAHVVNRAHPEKIVSVDISPEWNTKRTVLSGSSDGTVKQWGITKVNNTVTIKTSHVHDFHSQHKEEIAAVGYSSEVYAISVGCFGNIVKWDINSNVIKTYNNFIRSFKPICMSCSPHNQLNVAIGTKQGVVFVLDLNGSGKMIYKVRAHDDEIINLSWCPQHEVNVRKALKGVLDARLDKVRNEIEPIEKDSSTTEKNEEASEKSMNEESLNESEIVEEDDMFDIYKDHESDEFGHKKYQPEDIYVKVKKENEASSDFLAECMKLKNDILNRKSELEPSIESLVEALDKTHVNGGSSAQSPETPGDSTGVSVEQNNIQLSDEQLNGSGDYLVETKVDPSDKSCHSSVHVHRHLLVTIGKYGGIRIWSKTGKLISSCAVPSNMSKQRNKAPGWLSVLWYKPDLILIVDGKSEVLQCNPLIIDCKNKLEWRIVHSLHKRGLYAIKSAIPRVQKPGEQVESSPIWTISQDRNLIEYSLEEKKPIRVFQTCGGFIYSVATCPYDAKKVAVSVGDGAVRVWETDVAETDETKLTAGHVNSYWQNVQGKVLTIAWHPTKENCLAFATAEARIGLIDTNGKVEKPAKVLQTSLSSAVYGLCWGEGNHLYACGGGELVMYNTTRPENVAISIQVTLEGKEWQVSEIKWTPRAMLVGSMDGAVAALTPNRPHTVVAAAFPYTKMIHKIDWHPVQVSESNEESQYKNLIAVCSLDKHGQIAILELSEKEDGNIKLSVNKMLSGHKAPVFTVAWNPHREGVLLSSSQDCTVRVWAVETSQCTAIFGGHTYPTMGVAWSGFPALGVVLSGSGDCCLRLWDVHQHPADKYIETKQEVTTKKKKGKEKKVRSAEEVETTTIESDDQVATNFEKSVIASKKFLLPITQKQITVNSLNACRELLKKHLEKTGSDSGLIPNGTNQTLDQEYGTDFIKMFGTINDVNELLQLELDNHEKHESHESWIMLSIFRGRIDEVFKYASQRDIICPYLLSLAPCVSFKYWKDATQLYLTQIDRLVAKGEENMLCVNRSYGGSVFRKVATLLSVQDILSAVKVLKEAHLFKEAYILCRSRYMDTVAEETLRQWAQATFTWGTMATSAACHIVLGDLTKAADALGKTTNEDHLSLAADIAKMCGQMTYADHIAEKSQKIRENKETSETEEALKELPSRIELLMKEENCGDNNEK